MVARHEHNLDAPLGHRLEGPVHRGVFGLFFATEVPTRMENVPQQPKRLGIETVQPFHEVPLPGALGTRAMNVGDDGNNHSSPIRQFHENGNHTFGCTDAPDHD